MPSQAHSGGDATHCRDQPGAATAHPELELIARRPTAEPLPSGLWGCAGERETYAAAAFFSRSANCLRNLATFGATTAWQ